MLRKSYFAKQLSNLLISKSFRTQSGLVMSKTRIQIKAFTKSIMDLDEIRDIMAKAMTLMGIDSDPTSGSKSGAFARDFLSVEIEGRSRPQLTLVDIPGVI